MIFFIFIILIILLLSVVFAWQNSTVVTVYFLAGKFEASVALLVMIALLLGIFIGVLALLPGLLKRSWHLRKTKKELNKFSRQVDNQAQNQMITPESPNQSKEES